MKTNCTVNFAIATFCHHSWNNSAFLYVKKIAVRPIYVAAQVQQKKSLAYSCVKALKKVLLLHTYHSSAVVDVEFLTECTFIPILFFYPAICLDMFKILRLDILLVIQMANISDIDLPPEWTSPIEDISPLRIAYHLLVAGDRWLEQLQVSPVCRH